MTQKSVGTAPVSTDTVQLVDSLSQKLWWALRTGHCRVERLSSSDGVAIRLLCPSLTVDLTSKADSGTSRAERALHSAIVSLAQSSGGS